MFAGKVALVAAPTGRGQLQIMCSTHPQHKAVKLMNHRRPKKRNPADRRHGPAKYPDLPAPPPEYVVISSK